MTEDLRTQIARCIDNAAFELWREVQSKQNYWPRGDASKRRRIVLAKADKILKLIGDFRTISKDDLARAHTALCKAMGINPETSPAMLEALRQAIAALGIDAAKQ